MDVTFLEFSRGRDFTIEVGYFDTVQEIKQKIQKYQGIPMDSQTLIFKGQVMIDERNTEFYEVLHHSKIQLQVKPAAEPPPKTKSIVKIEEEESLTCPSLLQLIIKIPSLKKQFSVDMEAKETVSNLKKKIHAAEKNIPSSTQFTLIFEGNELKDQCCLEDYAIRNLSEINVVLRVKGSSSISKRLRLIVVLKGGAQKIQVEVNPCDNVGELRKKLQKLQQKFNFSLPSEGYFFIYKQNVMDDDQSFQWHDVKQGDAVEIFNGSVTGGS